MINHTEHTIIESLSLKCHYTFGSLYIFSVTIDSINLCIMHVVRVNSACMTFRTISHTDHSTLAYYLALGSLEQHQPEIHLRGRVGYTGVLHLQAPEVRLGDHGGRPEVPGAPSQRPGSHRQFILSRVLYREHVPETDIHHQGCQPHAHARSADLILNL